MRKVLEDHGQSQNGKKSVLMERLFSHLNQGENNENNNTSNKCNNEKIVWNIGYVNNWLKPLFYVFLYLEVKYNFFVIMFN